MRALILAALLAAPLMASPALAAGDGGADPGAPDAFAGQPKPVFYNVEDRMAAMEAKAASLPGAQAHRARAQMALIRGFERTQRAKHGGELRDWDREALNVRLDRLQAMMPALD